MEKEIKFKVVGQYNGHSIKNNNTVDLSFKFWYDELVNSIKLIQLLNENITIAAKIGDGKPFVLGMFMIKDIKIGSDGQMVAKFNSHVDYVEIDNFKYLIVDLLAVMFKATVTIEGVDEGKEIEKWIK